MERLNVCRYNYTCGLRLLQIFRFNILTFSLAGSWAEHFCMINGTSTVVKGLKEGKRYKFRVSAVNAFGRSEPLEGDAITAKNPFGMCSCSLGDYHALL